VAVAAVDVQHKRIHMALELCGGRDVVERMLRPVQVALAAEVVGVVIQVLDEGFLLDTGVDGKLVDMAWVAEESSVLRGLTRPRLFDRGRWTAMGLSLRMA
jgi:hypothetical protein